MRTVSGISGMGEHEGGIERGCTRHSGTARHLSVDRTRLRKCGVQGAGPEPADDACQPVGRIGPGRRLTWLPDPEGDAAKGNCDVVWVLPFRAKLFPVWGFSQWQWQVAVAKNYLPSGGPPFENFPILYG
jgi:hypothetical protein